MMLEEVGITFEESVRKVLKGRDDADRTQAYAALCNTLWRHTDGREAGCTWRYAGSLVARPNETYLDYYCGGNEGIVRGWFSLAMRDYGWNVLPRCDRKQPLEIVVRTY